LIDNGDGQENTCTRTNGSHEISEDGESTNTATTESSCGWDVSIEVLNHGLFSHTFDNHLLVDQLSYDILGTGARNVNPDSGEEGAGGENEDGVDEGVDWISLNIIQALGRTDVVSKTTDWGRVSRHISVLPFTEESNDEVASELSSQDLSEEIDIGNESSLKDDWNVTSVEKLDWVWLLGTSHLLATQGEFDSESLEIDDHKGDDDGGQEVAEIWCILAIEGLLQSIELVRLGQEEVEKGDDGSLELSTLISSDGNWGEGLPKDGLADVGGDEKGDT